MENKPQIEKDKVICTKCKKVLPEGWNWLLKGKFKRYKITCPDCLQNQVNQTKEVKQND